MNMFPPVCLILINNTQWIYHQSVWTVIRSTIIVSLINYSNTSYFLYNEKLSTPVLPSEVRYLWSYVVIC